jgi:hypothetical protein
MYTSLLLPWSKDPTPAETTYRDAGLVRTKGTLFLLPPTNTTLRETYSAPPRPRTRMSSGAVALCKHFERGDASSEHGRAHPFWALPQGSNENKTTMAGQILEDMLSQAVWKNVMLLHHGVAVYEIRNQKGFGMRWTLDIEEEKKEVDAVDEQAKVRPELDNFEKDWHIIKTTFRGFLEPIEGMDHDLNRSGALADL